MKFNWKAAVLGVAPVLLSCTMGQVGEPQIEGSTSQTLAAKGCSEAFSGLEAGTFVMLKAGTGDMLICDKERAATPFVPASTYKVPHALIALELGVAEGPDEVIAWDGKKRAVAAWNSNATLASALQNSVIWYYQHIARRIGHDRMAAQVAALDFGNADIGPDADLTHFWLDGALRISALEQIAFLDRLRREDLPASSKSQRIVREMMKVRNLPDGGVLYAKSGLVLPIDPETGDITNDKPVQGRVAQIERVGWYVGWVSRAEDSGGDVVYALNIRIREKADANFRAPIVTELLAANGIRMN